MYKLTAISPQQKGNLLNIFVNDEYCFSADPGFIADNDLFVGKTFNDEALDCLKTDSEIRKAVRHSLFLLEYRDFSVKELADRLEHKGYQKQIAFAAAEKVAELGYIDDRRYAERLIERKKTKVGKKQIMFDLTKSGIPREDAELLLDEMYGEEDGVKAVLKEMKKKLKGAAVEDKAVLKKLFASFGAKGFDFETIKKAYEKYCENEEDSID